MRSVIVKVLIGVGLSAIWLRLAANEVLSGKSKRRMSPAPLIIPFQGPVRASPGFGTNPRSLVPTESDVVE